MLFLIIRRAGIMVLTMLAMSFLVFLAVEANPEGIARKAIGQFTSLGQRISWLTEENYFVAASEDEKADYESKGNVLYKINKDTYVVLHPPAEGVTYSSKRIIDMTNEESEVLNPVQVSVPVRYVRWLVSFVGGDLGYSYRFKTDISNVLWGRLINTGKLAGLVMLIMVPLSLFIGVMAGMREGSFQDRFFSFIAIFTTSIPEFASAVMFVAVFVFWLEWLPGTSISEEFVWAEVAMPIAVLVLYGSGYIARITRASMSEVMRSAFIRTAILKGLPYRQVIVRHALRNALITPVTVIMLQFPWLLSGVIVVEYFFSYKGFGSLVWEAANNKDPFLIEACAMVAVVVVVVTQLIADIIYTYVNPRIRFQ